MAGTMDRRDSPGISPEGGLVEQVLLVFDPALGVDAAVLAAEWAGDPEAKQYLAGEPVVRRDRATAFHAGLMELVVIPLAVNVASTVLIDISIRLVKKVRKARGGAEVRAAVEQAPSGEKVVLVTEGQSADQIDS